MFWPSVIRFATIDETEIKITYREPDLSPAVSFMWPKRFVKSRHDDTNTCTEHPGEGHDACWKIYNGV